MRAKSKVKAGADVLHGRWDGEYSDSPPPSPTK